MAAACGKCGGTEEGMDRRHRHGCPFQTEHERIKELEEALTLARYEINRVLDHPISK